MDKVDIIAALYVGKTDQSFINYEENKVSGWSIPCVVELL